MFPVFFMSGGENCIVDFTITSDQINWNLLANMLCTPTSALTVGITVNAGVKMQGITDLSGLAAGSTINLTNNGSFLGFGGAGGNAAEMWSNEIDACGTFQASTAGAAGGTAITLGTDTTTINITNASGEIWAGGGGGGGGGSEADFTGAIGGGGGGGGGAGYASAAGGSGGGGGGIGGQGDPGVAGVTYPTTGSSAGGAGGASGGGTQGGAGGASGDWGVAGSAGVAASGGDDCTGAAASGGTQGFAVLGANATISFVSGGSSPNVEGQVSP